MMLQQISEVFLSPLIFYVTEVFLETIFADVLLGGRQFCDDWIYADRNLESWCSKDFLRAALFFQLKDFKFIRIQIFLALKKSINLNDFVEFLVTEGCAKSICTLMLSLSAISGAENFQAFSSYKSFWRLQVI